MLAPVLKSASLWQCLTPLDCCTYGKLEEGLMEMEFSNLTECSVEAAEQVG